MKKAYVDGPFGQIHFWTQGGGPALVLVHQSADSGAEFHDIAEHLSDVFMLVALDLPGHGASDDPPHEPSVDDYSDAVIAVMDALDLTNVSILGHHGGASTTVNTVLRQPERFANVILSGVGYRTREELAALKARPMSRDKPKDPEGVFLKNAWNTFSGLATPDADVETIFKITAASLASWQRPYDAHHAYFGWNREEQAPKLRVRTLLIEGEHDVFCTHQDKLQEAIPGSIRHTLLDCGAFMFRERPDAIAAVLKDFLLSAPTG